jgi:hypothetical protein
LPKLIITQFKDKKQIYSTKEKKCMTTDGKDLKLAECKDNDPNQQWIWNEIYYPRSYNPKV